MTPWIAQRGTRVAVVDAETAREAAQAAAPMLKLPRSKPRRWLLIDGDFSDDGRYVLTRRWVPAGTDGARAVQLAMWPYDWRGATLRRATEAEADAFLAAHRQDWALSSRAKVKAAVR